MNHPDRLGPSSVEAEEATLGSILVSPDVLLVVIGFLRAADFFIVRNGWVYEAILAIHSRGDAIDTLTVIQELRNRGKLDDIGGSAYITYLVNNTPTHVHGETYARMVERAAIRRRLLSAATEIARTALEDDAEISDVIQHCEATIFGVTNGRLRSDLVSAAEIASALYDTTEYLYNNPNAIPGLPTGFKDLDAVLDGLQPGTLNLLAARPGFGKTSLALNVATTAGKHGDATAFFSMEMSRAALMRRMIAADTGINSHKLRSGKLDEREWGLYTEATARIGNYPIHIDDTGATTPHQIAAKCRRIAREQGLALVVIDYLQLIARDGRSENATQDLSSISRSLKLLASELGIPILALSQLSRAVEGRQDKRPMLSDLRQSGALEQDADVVMFIYREDMYNEHSTRPNEADIIVAKQREGPTGVVSLYFRKEITAFADMRRETLDLTRLGGNGRSGAMPDDGE